MLSKSVQKENCEEKKKAPWLMYEEEEKKAPCHPSKITFRIPKDSEQRRRRVPFVVIVIN